MNERYVQMLMSRFSSILYNASQGDSCSKDRVLDSIKGVIEEYNKDVEELFPQCKVECRDFRKKISR